MEGILTIARFEHRRTLGLANDRNEARFQPSALASAQKSHENMQRLHIRFGDGFEGDDAAVLVTLVGTLISPVGEACTVPHAWSLNPTPSGMKDKHLKILTIGGSIPTMMTAFTRRC